MTQYAYTLAEQRAPRMGLVVLQTDEQLEADCRTLLPDDLSLYVTRVPSEPEVTRESLQSMAAHLSAAAALLPAGGDYDVVGYGCTSGAAQIGPARIAELVRDGTATRAVTEPVSALIAACRALDVTRLAFLSPYIASVSDHLRGALTQAGITSPVFGSFNEATETRVARISVGSIVEAGCDLVQGAEVDALFLSCTNLRAVEATAEIEARTGLPVLSSNRVLAWHMCALAGVQTQILGGR